MHVTRVVVCKRSHSPGTGPHTRGIISSIAEQDGSSKHNWRAKIQLRIAIFSFDPITATDMWKERERKINKRRAQLGDGTNDVMWVWVWAVLGDSNVRGMRNKCEQARIPVWLPVIDDGNICVIDVGCTGSEFGGDEYTVSQHSRSGNSLDDTEQMQCMATM